MLSLMNGWRRSTRNSSVVGWALTVFQDGTCMLCPQFWPSKRPVANCAERERKPLLKISTPVIIEPKGVTNKIQMSSTTN